MRLADGNIFWDVWCCEVRGGDYRCLVTTK